MVFCLLLVVFMLVLPAAAHPTVTEEIDTGFGGHPHCGLYCLYTVFKLEGIAVDFGSLVKPKYLGSRKGSSFAELKQATHDFGLNAFSLSRLTSADLKHISTPTILHVKSSRRQKDYDHFVLYLGNKNGNAIILDPPADISLVEFASLAPKWNGNALLVSAGPLPVREITISSRMRLAVYAGLAVVGIFIVHLIRRCLIDRHLSARLRLRLSAGQVTGLIIVAFLSGLLYHYFYDGGFYSNSSYVDGVQRAYAGAFIPKVSSNKMQAIVVGNNAVILDTRLERDYQAGHIANAVHLPINSSEEMYAQAISGLPKDKMIVLYCQSAGCKFAETMAIRLKDDGFSNVAVFRGGWVEWQKINGTQSAKTEGQKDENKV
jgi:rhodanese-related sulfurtransferase